MNRGEDADTPVRANLSNPLPQLTVNGIRLDMARFAEVANSLGATAEDVLSIDGYRDAKNRWQPNYESIRIVRKANDTET